MTNRSFTELLFTHTCPVTEFAVASHLNTANSCCHQVFLRHFRFQKCLPGNINNCSLYMIMISDILIQSDFLYVLYHNSRTRAIALYRPASHGCSFVNGARKEYVCFAAAFFSSALIISFSSKCLNTIFFRVFTKCCGSGKLSFICNIFGNCSVTIFD